MASNDINFEELDKAVHTVLQQKAAPAVPEPEAVVSPAGATSATEAATVLPEVPQVSATDTRPAVEPSASVIVPKRRGQFMDMVHPSSDMTTPAPETPVRRSGGLRQSPAVQPLSPDIVQAAQPAKTPESVRETTPSTPEGVQGTEAQSEQITEAAPDITTAENDFAVVEAPEPDSTPKDQESPFISGTEVEKRPLGAFAGPTGEDAGPNTASDETVENPTEAPVAPAVLPQELAPEVVSVESDDTDPAADEDTPPESLGMQSIAPQYVATQLAPDDDDDHPIFDTQQYHQPLAPPTKQRAGGRTIFYVLLFIAMLALGGVAGYLVWVMKLI